MNDKVAVIPTNPRQQAEAELKEEKRKKAVERMKVKLRELDAAETIVKNIKRELEELEREIDGGL